ncbi:RagB/SusD family nutrient uptake outer membrane protein [Pedobacter frigiditerrae]|uniref:RagB/SusD family nutrient uptake outer membrane protein n=1 Tax=Pedobacter frigiditerrae TaxID=2530452 RepID=A0A4R0MPD6_9SPHI|nr:RagB/SusD family nutrient uptake outer membrane protein [Pedobacter frigiditerrae]TCC88685.1 RagB/SusD family nutrient uptake outer membrane protein [Pedobacter frigiditerrae]
MKKFRTLITPIICGLICLTTNSCKKIENFLDKAPGVDVNESVAFSSVTNLDIYLNTIYKFGLPSQIPYRDATLSITGPAIGNTDVYHPTSDMTDESDLSEQSFGAAIAWNTGTINATNIIKNEDYRFYQRFTALRQIALFLKNVDNVPDITDAYKKQVIAEVQSIRAFLYLEMVKRYGGVPIITGLYTPGDFAVIPRNSVMECFNFIVKECDDAILSGALPVTQSNSLKGRITKLVPYAIKARALLYAASPMFNTATPYLAMPNKADEKLICLGNYDVNRWKLAADAALEVIQIAPSCGISLVNVAGNELGKYPVIDRSGPLPTSPFITPGTVPVIGNYEFSWAEYNNSEIILTFQGYPAANLGNAPWNLFAPTSPGTATWSGLNVTLNHVKKYEKRDGTKQDWSSGGSDLDAIYRNLDPRFKQSLVYNNGYLAVGATVFELFDNVPLNKNNIAGHWMRKLLPNRYRTGNNVPLDIILRLNEFYLNYAEALNEFSTASAATTGSASAPVIPNNIYDAVNYVRARSGMPAIAGLSQAAFRDRVRNERAVEMAFDDHRMWDIRRWLVAEDEGVMRGNMLGIKIKKNAGTPVTYSWEPYTFEIRTFTKNMYLHPFVLTEVQKGGLIQNPGW